MHWKRGLVLVFALILAALGWNHALAQESENQPHQQEIVWIEVAPEFQGTEASITGNEILVHLYFFWSPTCPHCREAHPYVTALPTDLPWLRLHSLELTDPENAQMYAQVAAALGREAMYVPAFAFCGTMATGYDRAETTGQALKDALNECHTGAVQLYNQRQEAQSNAAPPVASTNQSSGDGDTTVADPKPNVDTAETDSIADEIAMADQTTDQQPALIPAQAPVTAPVAETVLSVPLLGAIDAQGLSLPLLTGVIAGLDAFNPCAFFVLMFLLSLMVHARSRRRMLAIGAVFVFFSGLIYFIFMAAWLNIFMWIGELTLITLIAGIIAIFIALINIKDYFWFKQGVSLSIPESAKPSLYQRGRKLVQAGSLPAMLFSTVLLAVAANSYELLCTSGFPMVYTRMLTLNDLPTSAYYGYLAAYNIIYVIPLLLIVALFAVRFGSRKLSEREGRILKLLSGVMMLMLGIVLVFAPEMLGNVWTAVLLFVATIGITLTFVAFDHYRHRDETRPSAT